MRVENPELGIIAPEFSLPSTKGETVTLVDVMGENGCVVVFICNHCPYVIAIIERLKSDAEKLAGQGIGFVAICSNDANSYPQDSFENMAVFAKENQFQFPYLHDENQAVAKAYNAQCTPDFFGLNRDGSIEYRGRIDKGRTNPLPDGAKRDLLLAMEQISRTGKGPTEQIASAGCSIKWKD